MQTTNANITYMQFTMHDMLPDHTNRTRRKWRVVTHERGSFPSHRKGLRGHQRPSHEPQSAVLVATFVNEGTACAGPRNSALCGEVASAYGWKDSDLTAQSSVLGLAPRITAKDCSKSAAGKTRRHPQFSSDDMEESLSSCDPRSSGSFRQQIVGPRCQ